MSNSVKQDATIEPGQNVEQRYSPVDLLRVKVGFLGRFFGEGTNATAYLPGLAMIIAGAVVVPFTLACIAALFMPSNMQAADLFKIMLPMITLILGYLFGKN